MAGMGGTAKEFALAGTRPATEWSAWTALLGRAGQGFLEAFGLQEPLSRLHTPMRGRGGVPYRVAAPAGQLTHEQFQAKYGYPRTQDYPYYMRPGLGGTAGRAAEIASAWLGGGLPQYVPKSVMGLLGKEISEQDMLDAGYVRTLGGAWEQEDTRPPLDIGDGDVDYGYGPYSNGAGRYRRPVAGGAQRTSYGLVNWRIGL